MTTAILTHLALPPAVFAHPASSILLPVALGAMVGYGTKPDPKDKSIRAIRQPPLRPPSAVFGPVWTALYALTGYASHTVFGVLGRDRTPSGTAGLYSLQLGLNLAWMPLFFVLRQPIAATLDAVALLGINAYLATHWLRSANRVSRTAGYLWLPYVGWLAFATYLSAGAGYLNGWVFKPKPPPKSGSRSSGSGSGSASGSGSGSGSGAHGSSSSSSSARDSSSYYPPSSSHAGSSTSTRHRTRSSSTSSSALGRDRREKRRSRK